jgi:hypothetical protein
MKPSSETNSSRRQKKPQSKVMSVALFSIGLFAIFSVYFMIMHHHAGVVSTELPPPLNPVEHSSLTSNTDSPAKKLIEKGNEIGVKGVIVTPDTHTIADFSGQQTKNSIKHAMDMLVDKPVQPVEHFSGITSPLATRLHAVTYASHGGRDDRFCRAVESAIRHDVNIIILGWGVKWIGLSQKLEAAHDYASSLPSEDIILFTDAFDVMFTNTPEHILEEFEKENTDIIFAGN